MMTRLTPLHKGTPRQYLAVLTCAVAAFLSACGSVPGETLASGSVRRDVSRRLLSQANAAVPACKNQRISDTEVVEVHPDGKVAMERWTVEQCGSRSHYRVLFPPSGNAGQVQIRAD